MILNRVGGRVRSEELGVWSGELGVGSWEWGVGVGSELELGVRSELELGVGSEELGVGSVYHSITVSLYHRIT